jgi:thiamine transport system substrate-binding protein
MIKRVYYFILAFLIIQVSNPGSTSALVSTVSTPPELVLYAYDSFLAPGGLGAQIIPLFEKKFECRVRALASGDGTQLLTRLELDVKRRKPTAQVVVGIDQQVWDRAKQWVEPWGSWTPLGYRDLIETSVTLGKGFLPYDYGVFALIMDRLQLVELNIQIPPGGVLSIQELLDPKWKRNIILEDPRTSTPGLAFLLYSTQILEGNAWPFWEKFRGQ